MARETEEQIKELIGKSKKILITTKAKPTGDGLASCLALKRALFKINKNAEVIIDSFVLPQEYSFLPDVSEIKTEVIKLKKFIINLDVSQTGIDELSYDLEGNNLKIYLSPKRGVFTPADLKFQTSQFAYDLIITLGVSDLESLGKLYDHHRDFFYQIPVINIDNSPQNEQYGHVNLTDITATAVAEILYRLINNWPEKIIDEPIATALLTGMIAGTKSFKTANVTPNSLTLASQLIELGAKRQEIITHLYQTKTINTLKLWGRILARLQSYPQYKLIWSKLNPHDFTESSSQESEISGVIDNLIAMSPLVEIIILFYQTSLNETKVIARSLGTTNILNLTRAFSPQGDKGEVLFTLNKNLEEAEKEIMEAIIAQLSQLS